MSIIKEGYKYSYCDLEMVPAQKTDIFSRSQCNPYVNKEKKLLPLFTAPMDSIVDNKNYIKFKECGIEPIIHRNVPFDERVRITKEGYWCAYRMNEFNDLFCDESSDMYKSSETTFKALIDVANGHMNNIFYNVRRAKRIAALKNKKLIIMTGNIANPATYEICCEAGIDYVRCSIGTGSMCLTTANTAIGYPNASLINEIYAKKRELTYNYDNHYRKNSSFTITNIIADGGMKNYSDVSIALGLGADYVMIGGMFSAFAESCANFYVGNKLQEEEGGIIHFSIGLTYHKAFVTYKEQNDMVNVSNYENSLDFIKIREDFLSLKDKYSLNDLKYDNGVLSFEISREDLMNDDVALWLIDNFILQKSSHGMSSKEAQKGDINYVEGKKLKTSEGKTIKNEIKYTINKWVENYTDFLKSTMSYVNTTELVNFKGAQTFVVKSMGTMGTVNR